jgi:hypothetical protein
MNRFTQEQIEEIADALRTMKVGGQQVFSSVYTARDPFGTYYNVGIGTMSEALVQVDIVSPVGMICIPVVDDEVKAA